MSKKSIISSFKEDMLTLGFSEAGAEQVMHDLDAILLAAETGGFPAPPDVTVPSDALIKALELVTRHNGLSGYQEVAIYESDTLVDVEGFEGTAAPEHFDSRLKRFASVQTIYSSNISKLSEIIRYRFGISVLEDMDPQEVINRILTFLWSSLYNLVRCLIDKMPGEAMWTELRHVIRHYVMLRLRGRHAEAELFVPLLALMGIYGIIPLGHNGYEWLHVRLVDDLLPEPASNNEDNENADDGDDYQTRH